MGVLKARVGGSWVTIGLAGGPLPPGGALGDILVKQSATFSDATWGVAMPKITLTADNTTYPTALTINDSTHVTSRRAGIQMGSQWQIITDGLASGTKDFNLWNQNGRFALTINADALIVKIPQGNLRWSSSDTGPGIVTDGSYLDIQANSSMYFDMAGGGNVFHWRRTTDYADLMNLDASGNLATAGNITCPGEVYAGSAKWFRARGSGTGLYWESFGIGLYAQDSSWVRGYNSCGIYTAGEMRAATMSFDGALNCNTVGAYIRIYQPGDNNHRLNYSGMAAASVHPSSGTGSNGPTLYGYTTCIVGTTSGQPYTNGLYESGGGGFFTNGPYNRFSQRKLKLDPKPLDPEACLLQVRKWEPIEYTPLYPGVGRQDGFIVEDLYESTPTVCNVVRELPVMPDETDEQREMREAENATREIGLINAIDYASMVVRLTGAVQALADRINAIETHLEGALT